MLFRLLLAASAAASVGGRSVNWYREELLCFADPWDEELNYKRCCIDGDQGCWDGRLLSFDRCCWDTALYTNTVNCEGPELGYCMGKLGMGELASGWDGLSSDAADASESDDDPRTIIGLKLNQACVRHEFADGSILGIESMQDTNKVIESGQVASLWQISGYACEASQNYLRQLFMPLIQLLYPDRDSSVDLDRSTAENVQSLIHNYRAHTWEASVDFTAKLKETGQCLARAASLEESRACGAPDEADPGSRLETKVDILDLLGRVDIAGAKPGATRSAGGAGGPGPGGVCSDDELRRELGEQVADLRAVVALVRAVFLRAIYVSQVPADDPADLSRLLELLERQRNTTDAWVQQVLGPVPPSTDGAADRALRGPVEMFLERTLNGCVNPRHTELLESFQGIRQLWELQANTVQHALSRAADFTLDQGVDSEVTLLTPEDVMSEIGALRDDTAAADSLMAAVLRLVHGCIDLERQSRVLGLVSDHWFQLRRQQSEVVIPTLVERSHAGSDMADLEETAGEFDAFVNRELHALREFARRFLRLRSEHLRTQLQEVRKRTRRHAFLVGELMNRIADRYYERLQPWVQQGCESDICSREVARAKVQSGDFGRSADEAPDETSRRIGSRSLVLPQCAALKRSPGLWMAESHLWPPPMRMPRVYREDLLLYGAALKRPIFYMQKESSSDWSGHDGTSEAGSGEVVTGDRSLVHMWSSRRWTELVALASKAALTAAERETAAAVRARLVQRVEAGAAVAGDYALQEWTDADLVFLDQVNVSMSSYEGDTVFLTDAVLRKNEVAGRSAAVLGSERPWIEVLLLRHGARMVTTIDYRKPPRPAEEDGDLAKRWRFRHFHELLEDAGAGAAPRDEELFDVVVTYSSIEHSGLGRYGEPVNPWADVQTVGLLWCHTREGGTLLFGPNCLDTCQWRFKSDQDVVYFNAARDYGRAGWARLLMSWSLEQGLSTPFLGRPPDSVGMGYFSLRKAVSQ